MGSTRQSLIIGAWSELPPRHLEPFVQSLRSTEFQGEFGIIAGSSLEIGQRLELNRLADDVWYVDDEYANIPALPLALLRYLRRTRGLRRFYPVVFQAIVRASSERAALRCWSGLEYHLEGLQSLRYMHYYRYIMSRSPEPDFVMITDLRDVVFQRDPFEDQIAELEVYLEDAAVKVGDEIFNTRWMRDLVGASGVSEMIGSPISCSGTVMGTRDGMLVYLVEMMTNIIWRRRPMGSRDQAVHNLLIHRGDLPAANVVRNGYGRVLTLGKMDAFETDAVGRVLNHDGSIPAVLHQWDRHSALATKLTVEGSLA